MADGGLIAVEEVFNIINTPYAQKIGTQQNFIERWLNKNKTTKKWFKTLVQLRGMKRLQSSVMPGSYKTLWTAGQSSELIGDVLPTAEIIKRMQEETEAALKRAIVEGILVASTFSTIAMEQC